MDNKTYVVTITNQFCSMGRLIADHMSEILGIKCYNEHLTEAAARALELPAELVDENEERSRRVVGDALFPMIQRLGDRTSETQNQIFETQSRIIQALAEKESCVIVGRCSDYVLEEWENVIHFYIYAPYEDRVIHCMEQLHMDERQARKLVAQTDEERIAYHMNFTGFLPDSKYHKDLMVNSSLLGVEDTARMLAGVVKTRFGLK